MFLLCALAHGRYMIKHKELINQGTDADVLQDLASFIAERPNQCGIIYARLRYACEAPSWRWIFQMQAFDLAFEGGANLVGLYQRQGLVSKTAAAFKYGNSISTLEVNLILLASLFTSASSEHGKSPDSERGLSEA
eukprot:1161102-Pelagomonas_calceolata.AAC.8